MTNNPIIVSLSISADEYLKVYQGTAKKVWALDNQGRRINFPVNILQPFVTREGIAGAFAIYTDNNKKFQKIERLA